MAPPIEWLYLELRWPRCERVRRHEKTWKQDNFIDIVASDFFIPSGFSWPLLLNDYILKSQKQGRTVDAGVRISAHTLNENV